MAPMAASCVRQASGLDEFERAVADAGSGLEVSGLAEGEVAFLGLLARYEELLESRGQVELGQAAALLLQDAEHVFPRQVRVLADEEVVASWIAGRFLEACPSVHLSVRHAYDGGAPSAPDGLEVRFAFPSGGLAEPGSIADVVRAFSAAGDIVVACKNPLKVYGQLERERAGVQAVCADRFRSRIPGDVPLPA